MTPEPPWRPSRREQHALWYLQVTMRYVVGGGGLVWEAVIDKFREPMALLVFGALASATDVFSFVRDLIRTARAEREAIDRAVEEEKQP